MPHYYVRRRENLVDLSFDPEPLLSSGTDEWRLKRAGSWDQTFNNVVDFPFRGGKSESVSNTYNPENIQDRYVRYKFDPTDHGLEDDTVHFFKIVSLDGGSEQNESRILIILAPNQVATERPVLTLRGDAPIASDFDNGQRLVLPSTAVDYAIDNFGSDPIHLGFGAENSEIEVPANTSRSDNRLNVDEINLRTDGSAGAAADVQLYLVLAQGPSL